MANLSTTPVYSPRIGLALVKASEWHQYQQRKDGLPYLSHLLRVMGYIWMFTSDEDIVIAGLLHDVIEDTPITYEEIESLFGTKVASIVNLVSEDKTLGKEESKNAYVSTLASPLCMKEAILVSMMDKYDNLQCYIHQPSLIRPSVIHFMENLLYVFKNHIEGLPNEGTRTYSSLLEEMEALIEQMKQLIKDN